MKSVVKDDELMLITTEGIIIRIRVNDTALLGRVTSGVKLIDLKSGVTVASIARVVCHRKRTQQKKMRRKVIHHDSDHTDRRNHKKYKRNVH